MAPVLRGAAAPNPPPSTETNLPSEESIVQDSYSADRMSRGITAEQLRMVPFFAGSPSENFEDFFYDFNEIADLFSWGDDERLIALKQRLTAEAKAYMRQQVGGIKHFKELASLLRKRFARRKDATELLHEFLNFTQSPTMTVEDFIAKATNLSFKCFMRGELPEEFENANREHMLMTMLLKNLRPEIRRGVITADPKTVNDIAKQAVLEEKGLMASRGEASVGINSDTAVFAIQQQERLVANVYEEKIKGLENQMSEMTSKLDKLLLDSERDRRIPFCRDCGRDHFGRCGSDCGRTRFPGREKRNRGSNPDGQGNYGNSDGHDLRYGRRNDFRRYGDRVRAKDSTRPRNRDGESGNGSGFR